MDALSRPDLDIIIDSLHEAVIYHGLDMTIQWANRTAGESLNLSQEDMIGRRCHEVWYGTDEHCPGCPVIKALETGEFAHGEITTPDKRVWLVQATPVRDPDGRMQGVVEVALDITRHREAEEKQAKAQAMDDLINAMIDPVIVFTTNGKTVYANRAFCEMFQLELREFLGKNFTMIPGFQNQRADEIMRYSPLFREAVMEGRSGPIELPIVRRDESEVHMSVTAGSIRDDKNKISHIVVVMHDMSRRKTAERELKCRQAALESTLSATALADNDGRLTWADDAFLLLWDLSQEDRVIDSPMASLWQDAQDAQQAMAAAQASGHWEGRLTARKKDGKNFQAQVVVITMKNVQGTVWDVSTINDV